MQKSFDSPFLPYLTSKPKENRVEAVVDIDLISIQSHTFARELTHDQRGVISFFATKLIGLSSIDHLAGGCGGPPFRPRAFSSDHRQKRAIE